MSEVEVELPRHRIGVVAVRLFDQKQIAVLRGVAEKGERVFAAPPAFETRFDLTGVGAARALPIRA